MKLNIKKTRVGSSFYNVGYVEKLKGDNDVALSGRVWEATREIKICNTESYQKQLQTLLHENLHAMCWEYVIKVTEEENIVEPLTNVLFAFIMDNPDFIKLILKFANSQKGGKK